MSLSSLTVQLSKLFLTEIISNKCHHTLHFVYPASNDVTFSFPTWYTELYHQSHQVLHDNSCHHSFFYD